MRRIQGSFASRDPEEEKKKSRDSVYANLAIFGTFVVIIRMIPFIAKNM